MADWRKYTREFIIEFIELYRGQPALWKIKSKEYLNRDLKTDSYEVLIKKFKEVEPNADRDFVIKKIKNMRDVWRRQREKIKKSSKSGMATEDILSPSLWYYDLLNFLIEQETPRASISNIEERNESQTSQQEDFEGNENLEPHSDLNCDVNLSTATTSTTSVRTKSKRPREDILSKINKHLSETITTDHWDDAAKAWAGVLRKLPKQQQIFAEKLINDVLFEAQMDSLCRQSHLDVNNNNNISIPLQPKKFQLVQHSNASNRSVPRPLLIDPVRGHLIPSPSTSTNSQNNTQSQKISLYYTNFKP